MFEVTKKVTTRQAAPRGDSSYHLDLNCPAGTQAKLRLRGRHERLVQENLRESVMYNTNPGGADK